MMTQIKVLSNWYIDPKQRRKVLTILSGSLILIGLAARYLAGLLDLGNALLLVAAVAAGSDIVGRAWANLRNKAFSIELLVSIAFFGALVIGEYWEAAAVTFLFIFGAYLEARTLSRTREVLGDLLDLVPAKALILRDGRQFEVQAHEVVLDDILLIKPGTKVPVDGIVVDGVSAIDESAITGESIPEEKTEGDLVFAGSVNQNGIIKVRATGIGSDTTLARIIQRVEQAQEEKAPTQRFIERFAQWYTPAIIVLSIITFLISRDIELSLTLLVIGCPGALVISTPVSIVAGIGRAAKKGILIKGGEYLENASKIKVVALDKTGTLTLGKPRLVDIQVINDQSKSFISNDKIHGSENKWSDEQRQILHWAGIAEVNSEHPLARPILAEANRFELVPEPGEFELLIGKGVVAKYQGKQIGVGTSVLMQSLNIQITSEVQQALESMKFGGKTAVLVSVDEEILGILGIADPIREKARELVANLKQIGMHKVIMLTGDDRITAEAIAKEAGIVDVYANLLPEGKVEIIEKFKKDGHVVAMIGDGINDAPALATADIGIAMGVAGSGIAIDTADIALMADDLLKIPQAIALSKAVLRNIRQNVVVALLTVSALLAGVLLKEVHMAGGMLIHQASVLLVIINGMRLLRE
jgi:Cd2+/Zn2+-exporting ATPase